MAITWVDTGTEFSSSPPFIRKVGYEETARTSTTATYKIYLQIKINKTTTASYYGYPMTWSVGGTSAGSLKGSEKWYGGEAYRQFTYTYKKTGINAAGGSFSLTVAVSSSSGGSASFSKAYTIKYSTFNTPPTWSSTARLRVKQTNSSGTLLTEEVDGTENAKKFAENISALYVYWDAATDSNNNVSKYQLYCQVDNGSWSQIYSGANRYYTHSIGSGASTQGKMYDYYVKAVDSYDESSGNLNTTQVQKNKMTAATLASSNSIGFSTSSISFTYSGAANTNGNTSFTYKLTSSDITVYNQTAITATPFTLTIYKSGTTPTGPYIKFADIKSKFSGSSWKGTLNFTLTTTNAYGSTATKSKAISVDLRVNPVAPTTLTIGKTTVAGGSYIVSNYARTTVTWNAGSDQLGGAITYDVQYALNGSTTYTTVVSNTTALSATITLPTVKAATPVVIRVLAKTSFGYTAAKNSASETIHYWNPPSITLSGANRTVSAHSVKASITKNTSISAVAISTRKYKGLSGTETTFTADTYTIAESGLTETSTYDLVITAADNSGLTGATVSTTYRVKAAIPVFSMREKGVGVNCIPNSYKFQVNGTSCLGGTTTINGATTISGATTINNTATARKVNVTPTAIATASTALLEINTSHDGNNAGSNGKTFIGYNTGGKYYHYFRGSGKTTFDTLEGVQIVSGDLDMRGNKITNTLQYNIVNSSSGKSGRVYAGTGGIAMTADSGTNLHLGVASANDFNIDADNIWVNKPLLLKAGQGIYTTGDKANATQLTSNIWRAVKGSTSYSNMYIQPSTSGELRIQDNDTNAYRPIRTSTVYIEGSSVGYLGNNLNLPGNSVVFNGTNSVVSAEKGYLVLRSVENNIIYNQGSQLRVVAPSTTTTYRPVLASAFTVNSLSKSKDEITPIEEDKSVNTMEILKNTNVYTYKLKDELENGIDKKKIGLIVEQATTDLVDHEEEGIELYQMASTLWDVCKQQQKAIEEMQQRIEQLEGE